MRNHFLRAATGKALWTPAQINTALWLDAADAATVTASGGAISEWRDRSGNARHATQATTANMPTYTIAGQNGLNTIIFDGNNDWMAIPDTTNPSSANGTFAVCKPTHGGTSGQIIGRTYNWGSWYLTSSTFGTAARYNIGRTGVDEANATVTGLTNSTNKILSGTYNNANVSLSVNGGTAVNTAYTPNPIYNANDLSAIGAARATGNTVAGLFAGPMYEIIVVHSAPSTDTIQKIEGYMAHKWGLTANLPAGHPYKSAAPK